MILCFWIVNGCFPVTTSELCSYERDYMPLKCLLSGYLLRSFPTPLVDITVIFIYTLIRLFIILVILWGNIKVNKAAPSVQELVTSQRQVTNSDRLLARWTATHSTDEEELNCCGNLAKALDKGKELG